MKSKNFLLKRVNVVFDFFVEIFIFLLLILLIAFSFFLIYFANNTKEINQKIALFLEEYVDQKFGVSLKIENGVISHGYGDIIFTAEAIYLKDEKKTFEADLKNTTISLNYLSLLGFKLRINTNADNMNVTINTKQNTLKEGGYQIQFPFLLRFIEVKSNATTIKIDDEFANLQNTVLKLENLAIDDLNLKVTFNSDAIQGDKDSSLIFTSCFIQKEDFSCEFEGFSLKNDFLSKPIRVLKNYKIIPDKYFIWINGELNYLKLFVQKKSKKYDFSIDFNAKSLDFLTPLLLNERRLNISNSNFKADFGQNDFKADFNFLFEGDKKAEGSIFYSKKSGLLLDVTGENLHTEDIAAYWPERYLPQIKDWIGKSVYGANISKTSVHVKDPLLEKYDLLIKVWFENAELRYSNTLPNIKNAKGVVNISMDDVEILVERAESKGVVAENSVALYTPKANTLSLNLDLKGDFNNFINFFVSNEKVNKIFAENLQGRSVANFKFMANLNSNEVKIFEDAEYSGWISVQDLWTPVIYGTSGEFAKLEFAKLSGSNLTKVSAAKGEESIHFNESCEEDSLQKAELNFLMDLKNGVFGLTNILLKNESNTIAGNIMFDNNFEGVFTSAYFPTIKFCNNNFSFNFDVKNKLLSALGEELSLQELQSTDVATFVQNFQKITLEKQDSIKNFLNDIRTYNSKIELETINLYNKYELKDLSLIFSKNGTFDVTSNLINGFKNDKEFDLKIDDFGGFMNSFSSEKTDFSDGQFSVKAKVRNDELYDGIILLENYKIKLSNLDFSSKKLEGKFSTKDGIMKISDLKFANLAHTLILNGTIDIKNFILNLEAFYTPSTLDFYNLAISSYPVTSSVINLITLDTFKNGVLTLNYKITGSMFSPQVKFQTGSTSKKIVIMGIKLTVIIYIATGLIIPSILVLL